MLATEALVGAVTEAATDQIQEFFENPDDWSLPTGIDAMLTTIGDASAGLETPDHPDEDALDWLAYALLNNTAPIEKRREALSIGIHQVISGAVNTSRLIGINPENLLETARKEADKILNGIGDVAADYPAQTNNTDMFTAWRKVANPNKADREEAVVAGLVGYELIAPYINRRLLEINFTDRSDLTEKTRLIIEDGILLARLFEATRHLVGAAEDGYSTKTPKEIAEGLFSIGPLMAKIGQMLTSADLAFPEDKADFINQIGEHLQEGVAMPTELESLDTKIPDGITITGALSSASIGYVLDARMDDGKEVVVKITRPGTDEAIIKNARALEILVEIIDALVQDQAEGSELYKKLQRLSRGLPFLLDVLVEEINAEGDLMAEGDSQADAVSRFAGTAVKVPEVFDSSSDFLVMEKLSAERIDSLAGNRDRLTNMAAFLIQSFMDGKIHGDMHGGNVKSNEDGEMIIYDWGHVKADKEFILDALKYVLAAKIKSPRAIAKAYEAIQHPGHTVLTADQIESVADEAVEETKRSGESKINSVFLLALSMRHQSTIDTDYGTFLRSIGNMANLFKQEISKPEYGGRLRQALALSKSLVKGFRIARSQKRKQRELNGPPLIANQESS